MDKVRLGDVCTVVSGSTPKTGIPEYWDGDVDWITPAELTDESYVITESVRKITDEAVRKTGLKSFPAGTVILSSRAPIGKVAIAGKEMYCNQGFKNLICGDRISPYYLFWFLRGNTEYLNSLGRGATFKEISKSIVENIQLRLPSMPEQINSANTLKQVCDVIALRRQQLTALDTLIKARFVEMFGDPVDNPLHWKCMKLIDVCDKLTDGTHISPQSYSVGDYKYITAKNIKEDGFDFSNITYVRKEDHVPIYARCNPEYGDVLYIKDGVTTGIAMVNTLKEEFTLLSSVALLKQNKKIICGEYLCGVLNNSHKYDDIRADMGGAAITRLTIKKLERIDIPVPPLELQNAFAAFVVQTDKSKAVVQAGHTNARNLHR